MEKVLEKRQKLNSKKEKLQKKILEKTLENSRLLEQTSQLYKKQADYQKQIDLLSQIKQCIEDPQQYPTDRLVKELEDAKLKLEESKRQLTLEKASYTEICNQVNELKGKNRTVLLVTQQSYRTAQTDGQHLNFKGKNYQFSQVVSLD